jgi:diguanylate cyclase (GGDEF)-like protein
MLVPDQPNELWQDLTQARTLAEAERLIVAWLEQRYGRGAIALEKGALAVRPAQPTRLTNITEDLVAQGVYSRQCSVILNEFLIVESELRELGSDDVTLIENVTGYFRQALPRLLQLEGRETLTGLLGPARFAEELTRLLECKRLLCVLLLDIDKFGEFNAALGTSQGDKVVVEVAQLLVDKTRPSDIVFRQEGDEFAVLLPNTTIEDASRIAQRIRESIELRFADQSHPVTASIGLASWPDRTSDKDELLKGARDALYTSWRVGGNRVCLCPPPAGP